jgi:hypothetical protein
MERFEQMCVDSTNSKKEINANMMRYHLHTKLLAFLFIFFLVFFLFFPLLFLRFFFILLRFSISFF